MALSCRFTGSSIPWLNGGNLSPVPLSREAKFVGLLAAATVGATAIWYGTHRKEIDDAGGLLAALLGVPPSAKTKRDNVDFGKKIKKGYIVCPEQIGRIPPSTAINRGDFVIIHLVSDDGKFIEPTWAQVRSMSPDKTGLYVHIVGEFTEQGIEPIHSERHGFVIGEKMFLDRDCVFDVLHQESTFTGQILCGPNLANVRNETTNEQVYFARDTKGLKAGDAVRIVVASQQAQGTLWHEPLWVRITGISSTQQIVHAIVADDPELTVHHGLKKMSPVQFGRDCVVEIQ